VEALAAAVAVEYLAMLVAGGVAQQVIKPGKWLAALVTPDIRGKILLFNSVAEPKPEPQGAGSFGRSRKAMWLRLQLRQWY
jgi:hypothetical protein